MSLFQIRAYSTQTIVYIFPRRSVILIYAHHMQSPYYVDVKINTSVEITPAFSHRTRTSLVYKYWSLR